MTFFVFSAVVIGIVYYFDEPIKKAEDRLFMFIKTFFSSMKASKTIVLEEDEGVKEQIA